MGAQRGQQGLERGRVDPAVSRNRKRTKMAVTRRQINAKARERQALWMEGGHPNEVERLSVDLNGSPTRLRPDGLFAEVRKMGAGTMAPGNATTTRFSS